MYFFLWWPTCAKLTEKPTTVTMGIPEGDRTRSGPEVLVHRKLRGGGRRRHHAESHRRGHRMGLQILVQRTGIRLTLLLNQKRLEAIPKQVSERRAPHDGRRNPKKAWKSQPVPSSSRRNGSSSEGNPGGGWEQSFLFSGVLVRSSPQHTTARRPTWKPERSTADPESKSGGKGNTVFQGNPPGLHGCGTVAQTRVLQMTPKREQTRTFLPPPRLVYHLIATLRLLSGVSSTMMFSCSLSVTLVKDLAS